MNVVEKVSGLFRSRNEEMVLLRHRLAYAEHARAQMEQTLTKIRRGVPKDFREAVLRTRVAENDLSDALDTIDALAKDLAEAKAAK